MDMISKETTCIQMSITAPQKSYKRGSQIQYLSRLYFTNRTAYYIVIKMVFLNDY